MIDNVNSTKPSGLRALWRAKAVRYLAAGLAGLTLGAATAGGASEPVAAETPKPVVSISPSPSPSPSPVVEFIESGRDVECAGAVEAYASALEMSETATSEAQEASSIAGEFIPALSSGDAETLERLNGELTALSERFQQTLDAEAVLAEAARVSASTCLEGS